ncbi:amidohydrolase family protein [Desertihabitans brevis]|uniref:amidohydrolase family protein n=1 Tax=Desertihabitans brevis TaxID=2268447 RepID=UPI0018F71D77|nr:amidohydrolase/deacetylase family metallohydrolase [Desertihabitans brevis]
MEPDLALLNSRVLDPASGTDLVGDVAISDGRVAAVGPGVGAGASRTIDVSGALVTPGLVDLHTHVFAGAGFWGVAPDPLAWSTGVTTWVDAGSAGAYAVRALARQVAATGVRVHALLNVSGIGLTGSTGESLLLEHCDVDAAVAAIREHPALVRGIKVRVDRHTVGPHGLEPLRRGLEVAEATGRPLMAHIGYGPPSASDVVALLRPGDVLTHCATGVAEGLVRDGRPEPALVEAAARGVVLDLGHGSGGFSYPVLDALLAAGLPPATVSSDLHARSLHGPVFDLPTTMGTVLAAGMDLVDVVAAATVTPARVLGLDAGTLAVGAPADIAVFDLDEGEHVFGDAHGVTRTGSVRLVNRMTLLDGRPLAPRWPEPVPSWIPLNDRQRAALDAREQRLRAELTRPLLEPHELSEQFPRPEETAHDPC